MLCRDADFFGLAQRNFAIYDSYCKAIQVFSQHEKIGVSISGGADSDIVLDICWRVQAHTGADVVYNYFNTGLEYAATKRHLKKLESDYGVSINRVQPIKSIPRCCRDHGQPFLSKYVSEQIGRLQKFGFQWEDEPYEVLAERYPQCVSAVKWFTNWYMENAGEKMPTHYDIKRNKWLREFILENPPTFAISPKCCDYAKKSVAKKANREGGFDLERIGVRKAEGGVRALGHTCFDKDHKGKHIDVFKPIFWYTESDRQEYRRIFGITHSDCYTVYGFERTGCVGCPFNKNLDSDLKAIQVYEPKLYSAANRIFADAYEYRRKYIEFKKRMDSGTGQDTLF